MKKTTLLLFIGLAIVGFGYQSSKKTINRAHAAKTKKNSEVQFQKVGGTTIAKNQSSAFRISKRRPIPGKDTKEGAKIYRQWMKALRNQGFRPNEFAAQRGVIREELTTDKVVTSRKLVWADTSGKCELIIELGADWQKKSEKSVCN